MILGGCPELNAIEWRCVIIDEAHRLKNKNCKLLEGLKLMNLVSNYISLFGFDSTEVQYDDKSQTDFTCRKSPLKHSFSGGSSREFLILPSNVRTFDS